MVERILRRQAVCVLVNPMAEQLVVMLVAVFFFAVSVYAGVTKEA
jgi:hypothetical protein